MSLTIKEHAIIQLKDAIESLKSGYYYNRIGMMREILSKHFGKPWIVISDELKEKN